MSDDTTKALTPMLDAKYHRTCAEVGCEEKAGTPWTPYWCPRHDEERRARIRKNLVGLIAKAKP